MGGGRALYTRACEKGAGGGSGNGPGPSIILLCEAQSRFSVRSGVTRSQRARAGSGEPPGDASWVGLYRELGERVFRLAYRMTGDADAAQDLVHDTFVIVHD